MRHRLAQHRPAAAGLRRRPKSHRTADQCTPCLSLVDDPALASLFVVLRVNLRGAGHTFRQAYPVWRQGAPQRHLQRLGGEGQEGLVWCDFCIFGLLIVVKPPLR